MTGPPQLCQEPTRLIQEVTEGPRTTYDCKRAIHAGKPSNVTELGKEEQPQHGDPSKKQLEEEECKKDGNDHYSDNNHVSYTL